MLRALLLATTLATASAFASGNTLACRLQLGAENQLVCFYEHLLLDLFGLQFSSGLEVKATDARQTLTPYLFAYLPFGQAWLGAEVAYQLPTSGWRLAFSGGVRW